MNVLLRQAGDSELAALEEGCLLQMEPGLTVKRFGELLKGCRPLAMESMEQIQWPATEEPMAEAAAEAEFWGERAVREGGGEQLKGLARS